MYLIEQASEAHDAVDDADPPEPEKRQMPGFHSRVPGIGKAQEAKEEEGDDDEGDTETEEELYRSVDRNGDFI